MFAQLTDEEMRAARTFQRMSTDLNVAFAAALREVELPKSATNKERADAAASRLASFDTSALRVRRGDDE